MPHVRFAAIAVVAAGLLFISQPAAAGQPHATGGVTFVFLAHERFSFEAHDFGTPVHDRGTVRYRNLDLDFGYTAEIVCVNVSGNVARFGYVIPQQEGVPQFIVGFSVVVQVVDGGSPGTSGDLIGYIFEPGPALAETCDTAVVTPLVPVTDGNLVVHP